MREGSASQYGHQDKRSQRDGHGYTHLHNRSLPRHVFNVCTIAESPGLGKKVFVCLCLEPIASAPTIRPMHSEPRGKLSL